MLVLLHQEAQPTPVHYLDPLEDLGPSHAMSTPCQGQSTLPDVVLDLGLFPQVALQGHLVVSVALHFG